MKNLLSYFSVCCLLAFAACVSAESDQNTPLKNAIPEESVTGYVARIRLHTPEELKAVFEKAELLVAGGDKFPDFDPITVILHGPELQVFARKNYSIYKHIVELAARLEAFKVIDVRVCEVQMERDGIKSGDLPAFIDTVPYGPAEEQRLLNKGYQYF